MHIHIAGVEKKKFLLDYKKLAGNVFTSYFSAYKGKIDCSNWKKDFKTVIVDSGAHSFFSMAAGKLSVGQQRRKRGKLDPEDYFLCYKKWIANNWDCFDYYVELDIGELIGQEKIILWREDLKKAGLFKKCITVYHPKVMAIKDFEATVEESLKDGAAYIALEGRRGKGCQTDYAYCIKYCWDKKVRVHGFAFTQQKFLDLFPFYSVDSTSWLQPGLYGKLPKFIKGKLLSVDTKQHYLKTVPLVLSAYRQMEKYYTDLWRARGIDWDLIDKEKIC